MADKQILLEIVTPDRKVMSEQVDYVGCPGINGEFGVLANHIPFLSALGIGNLYYKLSGRNHYVFVAGGFAEVGPDRITVLAEVAEKAAEIDLDATRTAKDRAEQRMQDKADAVAFARAQAELAYSMARMRCRSAAEAAGTCSL